jgi:hypothetical protein
VLVLEVEHVDDRQLAGDEHVVGRRRRRLLLFPRDLLDVPQDADADVAQVDRALAQRLVLDEPEDAVEVGDHLADRRLERHLLVDDQVLDVRQEHRILEQRDVGVEDAHVVAGDLPLEPALQVLELPARLEQRLVEAVQLPLDLVERNALGRRLEEVVVLAVDGPEREARSDRGPAQRRPRGRGRLAPRSLRRSGSFLGHAGYPTNPRARLEQRASGRFRR